MIVDPRLFNYRLAIGSLITILVALSIFGYTNYKSVKSHEAFINQEKKLIENELSELLASYNNLEEDYDFMSTQLKDAKEETQRALDSLKVLQSNLSIVSKFKQQLLAFKSKNKVLFATIDSLNSENKKLEEEKRLAFNDIQNKNIAISKLENTNSSLNKAIDNAALITATTIDAKAYRFKSGKKKYTDRARRANAIDVCFTLAENPLTEQGEKEIYIQILSPKNNVVADKGSISFGNSSLIYSDKKIINYTNESIEICTEVMASEDDKPLEKGIYYISVFNRERKLKSTTIQLK